MTGRHMVKGQGCLFRGLTQQENVTEDQEREKENSDVKVSLQIDTDYMIY